MRTNIVHMGAGELTYEIRGIMQLVEKLSSMGMKITLENIGDPVAKGEIIPDWLKSIIADLAMENNSYAYSATLGDMMQCLSQGTNIDRCYRCSGDDPCLWQVGEVAYGGHGIAITSLRPSKIVVQLLRAVKTDRDKAWRVLLQGCLQLCIGQYRSVEAPRHSPCLEVADHCREVFPCQWLSTRDQELIDPQLGNLLNEVEHPVQRHVLRFLAGGRETMGARKGAIGGRHPLDQLGVSGVAVFSKEILRRIHCGAVRRG